MSKWERKFGKYAIPNLTVILILCYVAGYVLNWVAPGAISYLTLDPYAILHGQVWRLVTWVISPPSALNGGAFFGVNLLFVAIMLFFYFSLGTTLERVWGTWKYNVYLFTGMLLTIAGAFACMGIYYLLNPDMGPETASALFRIGSMFFSTYYVNMSIFLAYALTFPNAQVLLMMVIPVRVKWLGIIYGALLVLDMFQYLAGGLWFGVMAIGASLLNFLIFYLKSRGSMHLHPKQIKRRAEFRQDIKRNPNPRITKHKCAVCGQTDEDDPTLEFRFCSKCNGNYEYCQHHLFTHDHVK